MKRILRVVFIFLAVAIILGISTFAYFFVGKAPVAENIVWGVDFSQMQAEALGLVWEEVYLDIIKDLGAKNIKLHTQWDWVEGKKDGYYFSDIDWQVKQAEENGVKLVYVMGLKSGRWPECHAPVWLSSLSEKEQQKELLEYVQKVILRYKDSKAIAYWQVENEPFFKFGECPPWYYDGGSFLNEEVALVRNLDPSRKIIISDSGEQSSWFKPAKTGDIVGITMYRKVWARITDGFGFNLNFFFKPVTYWRKALIIKKIFGKDVIGIELQAEPWASKPFYDVPIEAQEKTMNLDLFKQNVEYAKKTGLDRFYFWGTEWWYWLKTEKNQPAIWNEARNLFGGK